MKRSTPLVPVLMLMLSLSGCTTFESTRSYNVNYDMANNSFAVVPGGGMAVNEGDMVSFQLTNVNPFLYDITINNKAVVYNTSLPPLIRLPYRGAELPDSILQTTVINVHDGGRINVAAVSRFRETYSTFRAHYTRMFGFLSFDEYLYSALKQPYVDEKTFKEGLQGRLTDIAGGTRIYGRADFVTKGDEFYSNLSRAYSDLRAEYRILDTNSQREVLDIFNSASRTFNDLSRSPWSAKVSNAADIYDMVQSTPFVFSSFKEQAGTGGVSFVIDGRRKSESSIASYEIKPFNLEYNVKVNGGWKIDASAGLCLSSLVNEAYTTREVNGTPIILKRKTDILNYGPGVLMHFYYQPFGIGTNLGLFTNNFSNIQFLFGPSLLLGDSRFCVNGGVTMGKVARLADGYEVGGPLDAQSTVATVVPTTDRLDLGWYVGFSYNFTNSFRK